MLEFKVRAGSLVQKKEDQELERLTAMVQPFIQNLNGWSEENRAVIENDVLLPCAMRMLELSNTDISQTLADSLSTQIAKNMMAEMQSQIDFQQSQLNGMQDQLAATQQALPPESQEQLAQEPLAGSPDPMSQVNPDIAGASLSSGEDVNIAEPMSSPEEETPGQQVDLYDSLLSI